MTKVKGFGLTAILLFACFSGLQAGDLKPVILGYYPSWDTGIGPSQINYKLFTHLCHAFMGSDQDGNLKMESKGNMPSADLTRLAHAASVKVLISLGGEDSGKVFNPMGKNSKAASKFVDSVIDVLVKYHYDGVDVDWEFPENDQDKKDLTALVALFRQKLDQKAPGSLITMAVPAGDWAGKWYDAQALLPLVDFVNVMTYDFHGPWGTSGHNASLFHDSKDKTDESLSVVQAMDYWTKDKKWPVTKLLVGIPCYGHGFVGKWYETPKEKSKYGEMAYKDILLMIKQGWVKHRDEEAGVPYLTSPKGDEFLSYEDEQSAQDKGSWAKKYHFRGIFFWEITEDVVRQENELIKTARKAFLAK